ncbi:MAG TPA: hypothetical protein VKP30_27735, partial [Polyangiaceae bacterium]|nr:hypothetical protein [Polyangiaceae bacterium]
MPNGDSEMSKPADSGLAIGAAVALAATASLATKTAHAAAPKLLVFLHVAVKQRALQSALQGGLPGTEVTAVGRVGDFERALKAGTDAVLASLPVLSSFRLRVQLQGSRAGASDEKYALIGVSAEPNPAKVASVGALDLLGRDGTNTFVYGLLGAAPRVERVSKVEDLLPLLQMQRVDAILLPSRLFAEVRSASKLLLVSTELRKTVGLPAVATVTPSGDAVAASVG